MKPRVFYGVVFILLLIALLITNWLIREDSNTKHIAQNAEPQETVAQGAILRERYVRPEGSVSTKSAVTFLEPSRNIQAARPKKAAEDESEESAASSSSVTSANKDKNSLSDKAIYGIPEGNKRPSKEESQQMREQGIVVY